MAGCAATQLALEKKDFDIRAKMSDTIFLDPAGPDRKTVFIDAMVGSGALDDTACSRPGS